MFKIILFTIASAMIVGCGNSSNPTQKPVDKASQVATAKSTSDDVAQNEDAEDSDTPEQPKPKPAAPKRKTVNANTNGQRPTLAAVASHPPQAVIDEHLISPSQSVATVIKPPAETVLPQAVVPQTSNEPTIVDMRLVGENLNEPSILTNQGLSGAVMKAAFCAATGKFPDSLSSCLLVYSNGKTGWPSADREGAQAFAKQLKDKNDAQKAEEKQKKAEEKKRKAEEKEAKKQNKKGA